MTNERKVDIDAQIKRREPVLEAIRRVGLEAIRRGGLEAMKRHIQTGVPMVGFKDGQVVHFPPEELAEILKAAESADPPK